MRCIHGVEYNKTIQNTIVQNTDCLKIVPEKKDESKFCEAGGGGRGMEGKNLFSARLRFQENYFWVRSLVKALYRAQRVSGLITTDGEEGRVWEQHQCLSQRTAL